MKKYINLANLLLVIAILIGDVGYILTSALWVKSITSACFFIMGAVNLFYFIKTKSGGLKFPILMLCSLFFAMGGDILLEINFVVGAALFALGHILFFVSYCCLQKINILDLLCGACIFIPAASVILFVPIFSFGNSMQLLCVIYAFVISFMVGKAISNYIKHKNKLNLVILIGSLLFIISDLMLLFNVFAGLSLCRYFCLATYYPAECFLAFTIFLSAVSNNIQSDSNKMQD